MDAAAFHGIAGELVRMIAPDTESDPAALLLQVLVAFGVLVGRGPHYKVEGDEHHAVLYVVLVGATAKARKGTSWSRVRDVYAGIPGSMPLVSGLSTGEGLIERIRDPGERRKRDKDGKDTVETIPGVEDKRLLVIEPEFARVLRVAQRENNTLSATLRQLWDWGSASTLTRHDPISTTGGHVALVGHITVEELRAELTATDTANGFANRFLYIAVKRSQLLPFGGAATDPAQINAFATRLAERAKTARTQSRVGMTQAARGAWIAVYPELSTGSRGLHGAVTARAEAQVCRLALIYALLDGSAEIEPPHLLAALAVWKYCDATTRQVWGSSLGDRIADEIMRALRQAGDTGLTRTEINNIFKRNVPGERIGAALDLLRRRRLAARETVSSTDSGRPPEVWKVTKR
jgi:hypothetical protein